MQHLFCHQICYHLLLSFYIDVSMALCRYFWGLTLSNASLRSLQWIRPGLLFDSIRDAALIVSPKTEYLGSLVPTTAAVHGPEWKPIIISTQPSCQTQFFGGLSHRAFQCPTKAEIRHTVVSSCDGVSSRLSISKREANSETPSHNLFHILSSRIYLKYIPSCVWVVVLWYVARVPEDMAQSYVRIETE